MNYSSTGAIIGLTVGMTAVACLAGSAIAGLEQRVRVLEAAQPACVDRVIYQLSEGMIPKLPVKE